MGEGDSNGEALGETLGVAAACGAGAQAPKTPSTSRAPHA
jgi:hypothetical protein